MGRIIAIDYGAARIGVASTDENKILAMPLMVVKTENTLDKTIETLLKKLSIYLPKTEMIVIGYPLLLSGEKSKMTLEVESFKKKLESNISIPITFYDERLTSAAAEDFLKELNLNRKKRAKKLDEIAAMIILQDYLESINLK